MKIVNDSNKRLIGRAWHFVKPIIGLPLLYLGVVMLAVHFAFHLNSNSLLLLALLLEVIGAAAHYVKVKRA